MSAHCHWMIGAHCLLSYCGKLTAPRDHTFGSVWICKVGPRPKTTQTMPRAGFAVATMMQIVFKGRMRCPVDLVARRVRCHENRAPAVIGRASFQH
jgi:hypothetical protein